MKSKLLVALVSVLVAVATNSYAGKDGVDFPQGYRNWLHVKSMLIQPGHALENPKSGYPPYLRQWQGGYWLRGGGLMPTAQYWCLTF